MCVSPIRIRIKNTSSYIYRDRSGKTILHKSSPYRYTQVPCGKCFECTRKKVNSLIFRSMQEFADCGKRGIFLTLTYDNNHIPLHPYVRSSGSFPDMISVWDKVSVQKYLKSLNEKILYAIGTSRGLRRLSSGKVTKEWNSFLKSEPRPISYLCVCERGSSDIYISDNGRVRQGTSRPHYHIAVFLRSVHFDLESLKKLMIDTWCYGSVYPLVIETNIKKYRDELGSIRYICKYMNSSKLSSYDHPRAKMSDLVFSSDVQRRNALPFCLMSKFFGVGYLSRFDSVPLKEELCSMNVSIPSPCGGYSINLPRYYKDKLTKYTVRREHIPSRYCLKKSLSGNPYSDIFQSYRLNLVSRTPSEYISEHTEFGNACRYYSRYLLAKNAYNRCCSYFSSPHSEEYIKNHDVSRLSSNIFREYVLGSSSRSFIKSYIYGLLSHESSLAYASTCFVDEALSTIRTNQYLNYELQYKKNISSAIKSKPELFNVIPL